MNLIESFTNSFGEARLGLPEQTAVAVAAENHHGEFANIGHHVVKPGGLVSLGPEFSNERIEAEVL